MPTGEAVVVEVTGLEGLILEMEDVNFHFDSPILLPEPRCDAAETTPGADRVTGLAVLRACYLHVQDNPAHKLLIAGHTDTVGEAGYNLGLSQRRADNVLRMLAGNRDDWARISNQKYRSKTTSTFCTGWP